MHTGRIITIDLHGMQKSEAKAKLLQLLKTCPKDVTAIDVIHGCHNGQTLQKLVRQEIKHPRILQKSIGLNNGVTTLLLTSKI